MALPVSVPYAFANATTTQNLAYLDSNFNTLSYTLNGIGNGTVSLANVSITGGTISANVSATSIRNGTSNVSVDSANGPVSINTNGTNAMYIDASQNVGIGGAPIAGGKLDVFGAGVQRFYMRETGSTVYGKLAVNTSNFQVGTETNHALIFNTNDSERARIDSSGNLLVGATSAVGNEKLHVEGSVANNLCRFINNNAAPYGPLIQYPAGVDPNGTSNEFIACNSNANTQRFVVRSNGGIANYSANNVNLSDQRLKKDIQLAGSYLDKICAIPVKTFLYNDQTDNEPNLGVIAQDVETIAPELVSNDGFGETPEDGVPYKTIYQTDLQYALMKAIQEQQALIQELSAEVTALKAKVGQ